LRNTSRTDRKKCRNAAFFVRGICGRVDGVIAGVAWTFQRRMKPFLARFCVTQSQKDARKLKGLYFHAYGFQGLYAPSAPAIR
jgi:hypothetical protein